MTQSCPNCQEFIKGEREYCKRCATSLVQPRPVVLASRESRVAAAILDYVIVAAPWFVQATMDNMDAALLVPSVPFGRGVNTIVAAVRIHEQGTVLLILTFWIWLVLLSVQVVLLARSGQTLGKKAVGIKVVNIASGINGGFVQNVLLREGTRRILELIPPVGLIDDLFIFRDDKRCIRDLVAGTHVVDA